ncbi:hypothetical protein RND71_021753 [Anisodus tanguticus]|uniref:Uncharacterized protein n=1 Tax=Anisodus tanguticus TaxID=243964 RepID=A0AAE1RYE6_9SOLA|nr:hypothetical protein RND71_021753 [Anisodus tanguticus]
MHVNVVIATISGSIIGFIVVTITRPRYPYFKFTNIQIGIGNIGNVPLVLIAALCRDKSNPFGDYEICSRDGNAYISFGRWVGAIVLYTYVFHMLAPPPEDTFDVGDGNHHIRSPSHPTGSSAEQVPLLTAEAASAGPSVSKKAMIKDFFKFLYEKLKLKQIIQPAIIASIIAIIIGFVPMLRRLVFTSDAPLYFFTDSCLILGKHTMPTSVLSGTNTVFIIMRPVVTSKIPTRFKIFRAFSPCVHLNAEIDYFSGLVGAVANLRGCGKEAASILFWVHIFAVFSMAGWITLYLNILL